MVTGSCSRAVLRGSTLLLVPLCAAAAWAAASTMPTDWPTYGHDPGGMRYSPLAQIDVSNVSRLQIAWTYAMRPAASPQPPPVEPDPSAAAQRIAEGAGPPVRGRSRYAASQATPLVVGGLMYVSTPYRRVVALEAETGREVWVYEVPGPGQPSLRGVEYWAGDAEHEPRLFFGTRDGRLIALDAKSGAPVGTFGHEGVVDLKTPDIAPAGSTSAAPRTQYGMTSPPLVYRDLVITGQRRAGVSAARCGGRRSRVGCAHWRARVDVSQRAARRRALRPTPGKATAPSGAPASTSGAS